MIYIHTYIYYIHNLCIRARSTYLDPHVVTLVAAIDNRLEPEDLPLAPWY